MLRAHAPARTPGSRSWNSRHPLKHRLMSTRVFQRSWGYLGIWLPAFSLWSALLRPTTQTGFLASSQQHRAAKTNKFRLRGYMNSTILCWPTLAPLFQAMNRAVWKKKIHTRSKSSKICLFVMVSRLGEKVILHLALFYIFFHKQKALSGKRRTLLQKKKTKIASYRSRCRWEHQESAPKLNCVYSR